MAHTTDVDAAKVAALRDYLPATGAGIYLDTATRGPLPVEAAEAMREAAEWDVRVGRVMPGREDDVAQRMDEGRAVVAAVLGARDPAALVLAHSVEEAAQLARRLLGQETRLEHQVDPVTGEAGPPGAVLLDASLAAGAIPFSVEEVDADAVVVAGDRWLLGPEGIAALWLRNGTRASDAQSPDLGRTTVLGFARSVGWLAMFVGLDWIHERTAQLSRRLADVLTGLDGVELLTPVPPPAAIVTFRLANWDAEEAADELNHRVQALVRPIPDVNALRTSVGWFNTEAELDRFGAAVAELATHTPESLPRRPPLVVLPDR